MKRLLDRFFDWLFDLDAMGLMVLPKIFLCLFVLCFILILFIKWIFKI